MQCKGNDIQLLYLFFVKALGSSPTVYNAPMIKFLSRWYSFRQIQFFKDKNKKISAKKTKGFFNIP